jgi:hypothetical protein
LINERLERERALAGVGGGDEGFADRHGRRGGGNERRSQRRRVG